MIARYLLRRLQANWVPLRLAYADEYGGRCVVGELMTDFETDDLAASGAGVRNLKDHPAFERVDADTLFWLAELQDLNDDVPNRTSRVRKLKSFLAKALDEGGG